MMVDEASIRRFNDLLDGAFDKADEGVRLLREVDADKIAARFEQDFIKLHDAAMEEHGKLIAAARADDIMAFRRHGLLLTERMKAMQTCMNDAALRLFEFKFGKPPF